MARFYNRELPYMIEECNEVTDSPRVGVDESLDSDIDDDFELVFDERSKPNTDTSAFEVRNGKDMQGIPWERFDFSRERYRETRCQHYKNYESLPRSEDMLLKECKKVEKGHSFYDFHFNTRIVKPTVGHFQMCTPAKSDRLIKNTKFHTYDLVFLLYTFVAEVMDKEAFGFRFREASNSAAGAIKIPCSYHMRDILTVYEGYSEALANIDYFLALEGDYIILFQLLRNLLWATSKHDVYLMQNYSVMHLSSLLGRSKEVLNVAKPIVSKVKCPGSCSQTLPRVQISTMAVKDNLLVAGGFQGELVCKYLDQPGVAFSTRITEDEDSITNAVDIFENPTGSTRVVTANNDAYVRVFDATNFSCLNCFSFRWSVNNASVSPNGKLLAVLGDSAECLVADAQSGKVVANLKGHMDYSFASAWHPDGLTLATGNQDSTCRLWDMRYLSESRSVLKGRMGAIRAVKFTSGGQFLVMAEPADFVHIFDAKCDYNKAQEIDLFGEISGISFSSDTESLFVGVADRTYGSLLEFSKRHYNHYLDSIL